MNNGICPVCKSPAKIEKTLLYNNFSVVICENCGEYTISDVELNIYNSRNANYKLSFALGRRYKKRMKSSISLGDESEIMDSVIVPSKIIDIIDLIIQDIWDNSDLYPNGLRITPKNMFHFGIFSQTQMKSVIKYAKAKEFIDTSNVTLDGSAFCTLGVAGIERMENLTASSIVVGQAFVAMWFDDKMSSVYSNAIEPALVATGFTPLRIDRKPFLGKICEEILSEIQKSVLIIADVTGHRQGVYFEAGYALALKKQLIWTCREDDIQNAHFDTRQYNHIVWKTEQELHDKLIKLIRDLNIKKF